MSANPQISGAPRHGILDDMQGLATGGFLCAFGTSVLSSLGLVTGQSAGVALLLNHVFGFGFGFWFAVTSAPFYLITFRAFGWPFIAKSLAMIFLLAVLVDLIRPTVETFDIPIWLGLPVFVTTTGLGLLAVIRHGGSLGGLGVLALYVQERWNIRAGHVQIGTDILIFAAALALIEPSLVLYSLLSALGLNALIAFNHRRDWYVAR